MLREIGSDFWLNPKEDYIIGKDISVEENGYQGIDCVFLSTGRAAENLVLDEIEKLNPDIKKVAVIPPYTCHTILKPFYDHGYDIYTYKVSSNLQTYPDDLEQVIRKLEPGIVLLHNYFGFDTLFGCGDVINQYSKRGIIFIEDGTQSLFSGFVKLNVDYYIGSLRKWAGLPDGGFAISRKSIIDYKPDDYDILLTEAKLKASFMKYNYINYGEGDKREFLGLYSKAEHILDNEEKYYRISPISERVFTSIDKNELMQRRRNNYCTIFNSLKDNDIIKPIFGSLPDYVVPLYFPVYVEDRSGFQTILRENDIYAPIVWPIPDNMPIICKEAKNLYEHLICIPIDQRYDTDDMIRIIDCMRGFCHDNYNA